VNGCPCLINSNLHAALTELRREDEERIVWIDVICINQEDVVEKSIHVPLMHHVYQRASRVVIWLGRPSQDSDEAMTHVDILLQERTIGGFISRLACGDAAAEQQKPSIMLQPFARLFGRPWWTRMWVLQEVYHASNAIVMCGKAARP
ncbi:heterokaryon incompatibility, partial [Lasiosphaeria miniovina]